MNIWAFTGGGSLFLPKDDPGVVNSVQDYDPIDLYLWDQLQFFVRNNNGPPFRPDAHMTDYLSDAAVDVIEANRNRPFFLYLAYNAPHTPLQALKADYDALSDIDDHTLRVYGAMMRQLDRGIGRVLDALKAQGLEENTIVVFTSDNGGADYIGLPDINKPYRGWKSTFFEGGIHAPYLIKWPSVIPPGTEYHRPVVHFDLFTTLAVAAGAEVPNDRQIDGVDLLPFALGKKGDARPHDVLFWGAGGYQVVRDRDWKLQVEDIQPKTWLFNLAEDPSEQKNLADVESERVARMKDLIATHRAKLPPPLWPSLVSRTMLIDAPLTRPQGPGDEYVYTFN
ncbi:MAG: sulfatase-like hydrolase/transferase [Alphaproteobacteria bacterium]|nr:sulfatase-like hydrolase/transferase [Alphaproteobacteria bacterium]